MGAFLKAFKSLAFVIRHDHVSSVVGFKPLIDFNNSGMVKLRLRDSLRFLLESIRLLSNSTVLLADKTVDGLEANLERARALAESSPAIVTPLNKLIGYEAAAKIRFEGAHYRKDIAHRAFGRDGAVH